MSAVITTTPISDHNTANIKQHSANDFWILKMHSKIESLFFNGLRIISIVTPLYIIWVSEKFEISRYFDNVAVCLTNLNSSFLFQKWMIGSCGYFLDICYWYIIIWCGAHHVKLWDHQQMFWSVGDDSAPDNTIDINFTMAEAHTIALQISSIDQTMQTMVSCLFCK